jgi:HEPN domain-containing protein
MSEAEELRQRAESLLAMALKAREQGQYDYADTLVAEAAQFISDADALEARRQPTDNPNVKK